MKDALAESLDPSLSLDPSVRQLLYGLHRHPCHAIRLCAEAHVKLLWNDIPSDSKLVLEAYCTNHIDRHIFSMASRINHSCDPNVYYSWNPDISQGTFHAIQDIKRGDELTISYMLWGLRHSTEVRQANLAKRGFICSCRLCVDSYETRLIEQERQDLLTKTFYLDAEENASDPDWTKCKRIVIEMSTWLPMQPSRDCSNLYRRAALYSWRLGEVENTSHWVKFAIQDLQICIGTDHPEVLQARQMLSRIAEASHDWEEYHKAMQQRPLDKLRQLAQRIDTRKNTNSTSRDWRLDNLLKARWWAEMDMNQEAREHPDPHHVAVERLEEHARVLAEFSNPAEEEEPDVELVIWLENKEWSWLAQADD